MRPLRLLTALLALALLLLPGWALAAPQPIALADYQAMLRQGIAHLERAADLQASGRHGESELAVRSAAIGLVGWWLVQTPAGEVEADLTDLNALLRSAEADPALLPAALAQAREHLAAAERLERVQVEPVPRARANLEQALRQAEARSVVQRLRDWFNQWILGRPAPDLDPRGLQPASVAAGALAFAALIVVGIALYRSLAAHGSPVGASLSGRKEGRPDRPPSPLELREYARELSRQGDHLEGLRLAHLALLQHYDALKLIRYVPAQTNREHQRQLSRRHPGLARTLRALHDLVDRSLYSGEGATANDFLAVDGLVDQLWREGDAASRSVEATPGSLSSASSP